MAEYGGFHLYPHGHLRSMKNLRAARGRCRQEYKRVRKLGIPLGIPSFVYIKSEGSRDPYSMDSAGWKARA